MEAIEEISYLYNRLPNQTKNISFLKIKATFLNTVLKPQEAIEIIDKILELRPNDDTVIAMKADTLIMLERFEEAIKLYDKILEFNSSDIITRNKKINTMLMFSEQMYENTINLIYENSFNSSKLRWLNDTQKRQVRRLKAEGKTVPEIFVKISEFYETLNETLKATAKRSLEHGCIQILNALFGYEKAEQLMDLEMNFDKDFETKFNDFLKNLNNDGQTRAANAFMPGCRRVLAFNVEEAPPIMVSFKINQIPVEFMYDTGADTTIANTKVWRKIGSPHLYKYNHEMRGIGGIIKPLGRCWVRVEINGKKKSVWLYIVNDEVQVLGRNWMNTFNLKTEH